MPAGLVHCPLTGNNENRDGPEEAKENGAQDNPCVGLLISQASQAKVSETHP